MLKVIAIEDTMWVIRLPENIETRTARLAQKIGLSKASLAHEVVFAHIDDLESGHLSELRPPKCCKALCPDDVVRELGLSDGS